MPGKRAVKANDSRKRRSGALRKRDLRLDHSYMMEESIGVEAGLTPGELEGALAQARDARQVMLAGHGPAPDKLGWVDLPFYWQKAQGARELAKVERIAQRMRRLGKRHLILGIGGSSLGARCLLGAFLPLEHQEPPSRGRRAFYFAGHNLDADRLGGLLDFLVSGARNRRDPQPFTVEVVSKSGGTLETAAAFRMVREAMRQLYGASYAERVVAITDPARGLLRQMAIEEGYHLLAIPPDVGGRYSVLTPVGLLPAAVAGIDITGLLRGARAMARLCRADDSDRNPTLLYPALMYLSAEAGRLVTLLYCWSDALQWFGEWHDQLVAESLGKEDRGRVPVAAVVPRDLHARGQEAQDGPRNTVLVHLRVESPERSLCLPRAKTDTDGLEYLAGKPMADLLRAAYEGTALAYAVDGRPGMTITIPRLDPFALGELFYFFEWTTALEGLVMGVNPFSQPGVEGYKSFMYSLLGRSDEKGITRKLRALGQEVEGGWGASLPLTTSRRRLE